MPPRIRRLDEGIDMLGVHIRKVGDEVVVEPTTRSIKKLYNEIWIKPAKQRMRGKKIKVPKLKQKARGLIQAMPLDDEIRWWLKEIAVGYLDYVVTLDKGEICPLSLLESYINLIEVDFGMFSRKQMPGLQPRPS